MCKFVIKTSKVASFAMLFFNIAAPLLLCYLLHNRKKGNLYTIFSTGFARCLFFNAWKEPSRMFLLAPWWMARGRMALPLPDPTVLHLQSDCIHPSGVFVLHINLLGTTCWFVCLGLFFPLAPGIQQDWVFKIDDFSKKWLFEMTTITHDEESFGNHKTGNRVDGVSNAPVAYSQYWQILFFKLTQR